MNNSITRERLEELAADQSGFNLRIATLEESQQLARMALDALDSEPVFFIEVEGDDWINAGRIEGKNRQDLGLLPDGINYLYAAPQPLTDAEREELQELRRSYLALRGENEDLQAQLYEAESQADDVAEELQERRKADSEPVATLDVQSGRPYGNKFALVFSSAAHKLPDDVYFLYRHAQPAPERDQVRSAHAEWAQATFGNVGPVGPLKHLSKEALEAAEQPGDLSEWADMQFLLWDAQRRAGITDAQITQAMIEKLAVNKQREWPEPKDGEPRLHIKEQPAPVVPEDIPDCVYEILCQACGGNAWMYSDALWNACRAAMLQELKKSAGTEATCRSNENVQAVEVQSLTSINPAPDLVSLRKKAESIIGSSPAIPDGYVMVPKEPTKQMILAGQEELESCIDNGFDSDIDGNSYDYTDIVPDAPHRVFMAMLEAAPQEIKS